jgi:hypothetical protein
MFWIITDNVPTMSIIQIYSICFIWNKNYNFLKELVAYFPLIDVDRIENDASSISSSPRERVLRVVS